MPFDLERDDEFANVLESELSDDELKERLRARLGRANPTFESSQDSALDLDRERDEK